MVLRTFHSVVEIPIASRTIGATIPILILEKGEISLSALAWTRHRSNLESLTPSALSKSVHALGRFFDLYHLLESNHPVALNDFESTLGRFLEAREFGSYELGWEAVRRKTAVDEVRWINDFADFCRENLQNFPVKVKEKKFLSDLSVRDQKRFEIALKHRKESKKLSHLSSSPHSENTSVNAYKYNPIDRRPAANYDRKVFPSDKILLTISRARTTRDKLYLILLFFGGLRVSEPLHLFLTDISIDPLTGVAKVLLGDPKNSPYEWIDPLRGKRQGNRATFLRERYHLGPRNQLGIKNPQHAGWKGMDYENQKRQEAEVTWLIPEMGIYFTKLHTEYMHNTRKYVQDDHPYYFVNEKEGVNFGHPVTMSNIVKAFNRAVTRSGLSSRDDGVNPHGARHFFGYFCASHLKLPLEVTQKLMRHRSIQSTKLYYTLDKSIARNELSKANYRMTQELPSFYSEAVQLINQRKRS